MITNLNRNAALARSIHAGMFVKWALAQIFKIHENKQDTI